MNLNIKHVERAGLLYLLLPVLLFLWGWMHISIAFVLSLLLLYVARRIWYGVEDRCFYVSSSVFWGGLFFLGLWAVLSGIGRWVWQNDDHLWRNAIFNDLVNGAWPVTHEGHILCYYLGFWLPAAGLGKCFHSMWIADFFQTVWVWIGLSLFYLLIGAYLKKLRWGMLFILIFFSGIDFIGYAVSYLKTYSWVDLARHYAGFPHIEWSHGNLQASSMTTQLFWVFNQAIPFWVGMMWILVHGNVKHISFVYALLLLYSPFPFVGFAPVMIYFYLKKWIADGWWAGFKNLWTIENITALGLILFIGLYYMSNVAAGESRFGSITMRYLMFILTQYLVYLIFVFRKNRKDPVFLILTISALVFPLYGMGQGFDFCMRTNIPFIIYLMVLFMQFMYDDRVNRTLKKWALGIFILGAVTPAFEIARTVKKTSHCWRHGKPVERRLTTDDSIFDDELIGPNFIGSDQSFFFRYIAK